jgi:serine/threonine protein kinase
MGKLVHPFIVRYRESFIEDNTLNIVMEYCDNGDLHNYLKLQNKRPLKEDKIWRFFIEICVGLEYIHKNKILHRDIKTLNIFMNKNEEIKIGDLGVAKMLTSN